MFREILLLYIGVSVLAIILGAIHSVKERNCYPDSPVKYAFPAFSVSCYLFQPFSKE